MMMTTTAAVVMAKPFSCQHRTKMPKLFDKFVDAFYAGEQTSAQTRFRRRVPNKLATQRWTIIVFFFVSNPTQSRPAFHAKYFLPTHLQPLRKSLPFFSSLPVNIVSFWIQ